MRTFRPARNVVVGTFAAALIGSLAACSGGGSTAAAASSASATPASASAALLSSAARTLDATKAVRLKLTSSTIPPTGTKLVAGQGTMVRSSGTSATGVAPGAFRGSVSLVLEGNKVTVPMVSTGGKVYAKIPGRAKYQLMNLAGFGIGDPAKLLDPKTGISQLFTKLTDVTSAGSMTIDGASVKQVQGKIPGALVGQLLAGTDTSTPATARLSIDPATGQLRRAVLSGPFFAKGTTSTYTLNLDRYGVVVPIKAPAANG